MTLKPRSVNLDFNDFLDKEKCTDDVGHYCLCDRDFVRESISKIYTKSLFYEYD